MKSQMIESESENSLKSYNNYQVERNYFSIKNNKSMAGKYILLVEDEQISRFVIQLMLELLDCQVDVALDGKTAVQLAAEHRYDMILMDIGLPHLNGIGACVDIKKHEKNHPHLKPTPIIAITANTKTDCLDNYFQAGMQTVLFKPIANYQLISILNKLN